MFVFLSIWPTRPTHDAYAVGIGPGAPLFKLRTAITRALSAGGRPQTHPAIAAVDVSSMINRPKAPAESLLPGDSLTIPARHLATHDKSKRPSPNGKGMTCYFVVAGAGFEPATSGLGAPRLTSQTVQSLSPAARCLEPNGPLVSPHLHRLGPSRLHIWLEPQPTATHPPFPSQVLATPTIWMPMGWLHIYQVHQGSPAGTTPRSSYQTCRCADVRSSWLCT